MTKHPGSYHRPWDDLRGSYSGYKSSAMEYWLVDWTDTSLRYRHWRMCFERLLRAFARWQPDILFDIAGQPILEYRWIDSYSQRSLQTQFKVVTVTPSRCLHVRQDWYLMYYPEGMKARVSPVHCSRSSLIEYWQPLGTRTRNIQVHSTE